MFGGCRRKKVGFAFLLFFYDVITRTMSQNSGSNLVVF